MNTYIISFFHKETGFVSVGKYTGTDLDGLIKFILTISKPDRTIGIELKKPVEMEAYTNEKK